MNTREQEHEREGEAPPDQPLLPGAGAAAERRRRRPWTSRRRGDRHSPVPIDSASSCIAAQASSGEASPTVTCSIWPSIADGDLLPRRDRRRRLGVLELLAEGRQQLVVGQRRVVPRRLHRRQVAHRLVPRRPAPRAATGTRRTPSRPPCCRTARTRRGCRRRRTTCRTRCCRLVGDGPRLRVGAGVGDDADHPRPADERADGAVGELRLDGHVGHGRLGQPAPRRTSRRTSAPRRTPPSRA